MRMGQISSARAQADSMMISNVDRCWQCVDSKLIVCWKYAESKLTVCWQIVDRPGPPTARGCSARSTPSPMPRHSRSRGRGRRCRRTAPGCPCSHPRWTWSNLKKQNNGMVIIIVKLLLSMNFLSKMYFLFLRKLLFCLRIANKKDVIQRFLFTVTKKWLVNSYRTIYW